MSISRTRTIGGFAAVSAAAAMLIVPAAAHADGTKNPKYSHPPKKSQPKNESPNNQESPNGKTAPVGKCGTVTESGGNQPPTNYPVELGKSGPTSFKFHYDADSVPDKFFVLYEGKTVYQTGEVGRNVGKGPATVNVALPAGKSTQVTVRVVPNEKESTVWSFTAYCPE